MFTLVHVLVHIHGLVLSKINLLEEFRLAVADIINSEVRGRDLSMHSKALDFKLWSLKKNFVRHNSRTLSS